MRYVYTLFTQSNPQAEPTRRDIHTRECVITAADVTKPNFVNIFDGQQERDLGMIRSEDEWGEWLETLARNSAWKSKDTSPMVQLELPLATDHQLQNQDASNGASPQQAIFALSDNDLGAVLKELRTDTSFVAVNEPSKKDHINPTHYQAYILELQWLEAMQYLPRFRNPECFLAAIELQVRKYLDRCGGKDAEPQELSKSLWYHQFMVAYIKNGYSPIRIKDIPELLARK